MSASSVDPASNRSTSERKKLSLLIVQMGGVEEVFRSLMALKAIKHLYPEVAIHVLSRSGVSDPFKRVEWIESVIETPRFKAGEDPVVKVALWIDQVIGQNYEILVNWTPSTARQSRMSAIASTLIPAIVKLGDFVASDMTKNSHQLTVQSHDAWSMYRRAWAEGPVEQDIHFTDIITTQLLTALQIHAGDPSPEASMLSVTSRYFFKNVQTTVPKAWIERPRGMKWIAVHGPSLPERASEWIQMVLRRHPDYGMVLLGGGGSLQPESNARVVDLGSDIHFDAMISVMTQCGWLLAGPHPIVDLASLLNLRVLYAPLPANLEFSMKWSESGPYGNGHIVVVPGEEWKPEVAYASWSYFQSEWFHKNSITLHGHFENLGLLGELEANQVYKSRIRAVEEGGGVSFELAAGPARDFELWMYRVRGQIARAWFCGWLPSVEREVEKMNLTPSLIKRIRALDDSLEVIGKISQEARDTAQRLEAVAKQTKAGYLMSIEERAEIEEAGKRLLEIEGLMSRVAQVEPELDCMLVWYRQMIHNLRSENIHGMAKETAAAFDLVIEGLDLIAAYTGKTLHLAKPKAVGKEAVQEGSIPLEPKA
ncbi:hypothetical protein EB061_06900 [bacterium]|jgi:hypothetical protein|nr:hypothetical protein [bacterium]